MKKNPIRHIDIISVIPINSGVRFTTNPVIEMITFKRHPINAHKAAVLNLVILILLLFLIDYMLS